ncbi:MAG TPA: acyl-CoA dehydrogenase family protein [Candidatus Bathyarchaeia archaeon]|nr:acyl-CoA dehydrogenase family protein [Candidatus Bathyarchaeia archaeon]
MRSTFPDLITDEDFVLLERYEEDLARVVAELPNHSSLTCTDLLHVKAKLAALGYGGIDVPSALGGLGRSSLVQMLVQFVSGYQDMDFRDIAHIAHGRIVLRKGSSDQQSRWLPRILKGDLVGIAATEKHGGTTLDSITTKATKISDDRWLLSGEKFWISRLSESRAFVVFFKTENHTQVSAALIDAQSQGITWEDFDPIGLHGWSWGRLHFEDVPFSEADFLGRENEGLDVFRDHFLYYRPMIAATALGGAAAVFDNVVSQIQEKISSHTIENCRDSTLETLARSYVTLHSSLLSAITAQKLVSVGAPLASAWSRAVKAHSVDTACRLVSDLAILAGARSYQAHDKLNKVQRDLQGFLYADGIHDALYRAAGRSLLSSQNNLL